MPTHPITSQQVGTYYDQMAQYYRLVWKDNFHVGYWPPEASDAPLAMAQENLTDLLISRTPIGPGQKLLDVGCGVGRPGVRMAEKTACEVVGITVSQEQVVAANAYAAERGLTQQAVFHQMDAMALPFEPETFDAVWAFESLFHMPDRAAVLRHIGRVLRPGGRLVLTDSYEKVPFTPEERELVRAGFQVNAFITPAEYQALLLDLHFKVQECLDISENTRHSYTRLMASTWEQAPTLRITYGEQFLAQLEQTAPIFETVNRDKIGYFLLVAEKLVA